MPARRLTAFIPALLVPALLGLGGCVGTQPVRISAAPQDPHSLVYTYLMAHGMAFGYLMAEGPHVGHLDTLVALDHNASLMVLADLRQPSRDHLAQADGAVLSLIAAVTPPETALPVDQRANP